MSFFTIFLVAVALGMDSFALAVGMGLGGLKLNKILLFSSIVFLFHVFMPLIGLIIGEYFGSIIGDIASYIGAGILILLGCNIVYSVFKSRNSSDCGEQREESKVMQAFNSLWGIIILTFSVSVDALSVGFGLGSMTGGGTIIPVVFTIGIFAFTLTMTGYFVGKLIGGKCQDKSEVLGGIILILVGIKIILGG